MRRCAGSPSMPPNLAAGLDRCWLRAGAPAAYATGYLGAAFCRLYRVCRAAEQERFDDLITPTEYAWYLGAV